MRRLFRKCPDVNIVVVAYAMTRGAAAHPVFVVETRGYHRHAQGSTMRFWWSTMVLPSPSGTSRSLSIAISIVPRLLRLMRLMAVPRGHQGRVLCLMIDGARLVTRVCEA